MAPLQGLGGGIDPIKMTRAKMDQLFDWAKNTYPQYFPEHQGSIVIDGYFVRYYPTTDIYLGAKNDQVYVLGAPFGGLLNVDTFNILVRASGI